MSVGQFESLIASVFPVIEQDGFILGRLKLFFITGELWRGFGELQLRAIKEKLPSDVKVVKLSGKNHCFPAVNSNAVYQDLYAVLFYSKTFEPVKDGEPIPIIEMNFERKYIAAIKMLYSPHVLVRWYALLGIKMMRMFPKWVKL